jgi:hypothetical protein
MHLLNPFTMDDRGLQIWLDIRHKTIYGLVIFQDSIFVFLIHLFFIGRADKALYSKGLHSTMDSTYRGTTLLLELQCMVPCIMPGRA